MRALVIVAGLLFGTVLPVGGASPRRAVLGSMENVFDLGDGVWSGSAPVSDADFAALARSGVTTIVSVDGAKPDVESARRHGLRYVHLPVGYDGVSARRAMELAKLASVAGGPLFVHCHHGRHRGPAAAAVICAARNHWSREDAVAWLKQAGTADDYAGLYKSVREFRVPDAAALAEVSGDFPESAATPEVVDVMVEIDACFDQLKAAQQTGWREIPERPGIPPAQVATLLWEHFREMSRAPDHSRKPDAFRQLLDDAEKSAASLRVAMEAGGSAENRDAALRRAGASCVECHKAHRN